jgi:hypothetical protein
MATPCYRAPIDPEWLQYELWTFLEASCLLEGCNPVSVEVFYRVVLKNNKFIKMKYRQVKDAARTGNLVTVPPYPQSPLSETGHKYDLRTKPAIFLRWASDRGDKIPPELESLVEVDTSLSGVAPPWKERAVCLANEYLSAWRNEGYEPTGEDAALYVEGKFSTLGILGVRGEFLDWATIKREALTGITRRKPGAKSKKPKVPKGQRGNLP